MRLLLPPAPRRLGSTAALPPAQPKAVHTAHLRRSSASCCRRSCSWRRASSACNRVGRQSSRRVSGREAYCRCVDLGDRGSKEQALLLVTRCSPCSQSAQRASGLTWARSASSASRRSRSASLRRFCRSFFLARRSRSAWGGQSSASKHMREPAEHAGEPAEPRRCVSPPTQCKQRTLAGALPPSR